MQRDAIFRLHQKGIAIAESVVAEAAKRRAGTIRSDEIRPEGFQTTAAAQGVLQIEGHFVARIRPGEEAVQRQKLS